MRVTFLSKDSSSAIDVTGWTLYASLGRSRRELGSIVEVSEVADPFTAALGQIAISFSDEITGGITLSAVVVELAVDTGTGKKIPLMQATAMVQSQEDARVQYYKTIEPENILLADVPTVVQRSAMAPQEISMSFSTQLDPTFDLGVMVKFDELSPEATSFINSAVESIELKRQEVETKHAEIMGMP